MGSVHPGTAKDIRPTRSGRADNFSWLELPVPIARTASEVLAGLRRRPRTLPFWLFYDETGCRLFEAICETPEYYLRRAEASILESQVGSVARAIGPVAAIIEPGAGDCVKIDRLLHALAPEAYFPLDLAGPTLYRSAEGVARRHPSIRVCAVRADFVRNVGDLSLPDVPQGRRLVFYPGSSIGNFEPPAVVTLLQGFAALAGEDGGLLVGVDARKAPRRLHAAYNDARGLTARFNLNLLSNLNRQLGAGFDVQAFDHYAFYDPVAGRVEMHLVCRRGHSVTVAGNELFIDSGETLHTENAYKYSDTAFDALAAQAGWRAEGAWQDERGDFWLRYYRRR